MTKFTTDVLSTWNMDFCRIFLQAFQPLACFSVTIVFILLIGARVSADVPAEGKANSVIVSKCQNDLAQRLKLPVKDINVIDAQAKVWADTALGMPESGKFYAQVLTPGWRIVLETHGISYLYTASDFAFKFGGPLSLWDHSMLYVLPVKDEPNLNGDLYQCSLIGTNYIRIVSQVDSYYPQAKGMVLITRRTSRSGYDLLSVKAGKDEKAQRLYGAFDIGAAALNDTQDTWAAFVKPRLGTGWNIAVAGMGKDNAITLPLPNDVKPEQIVWSGERIMVLVSKNKVTFCYDIIPTSTTQEWKALDSSRFPGALDFVLNKSESLEIEQTGTKEKPNVEITRVWFTGDRKAVAAISGLTMHGYELIGSGYAFIWGELKGQSAAFSVNISTGVVTPGFCGTCQDIKPFKFSPITKP